MIKYIASSVKELTDTELLAFRSGERLSELMEAVGVDDEYVAGVVHRDRSTVARYRSGNIEMPKDVIARLSMKFGVSKLWLMGFEDLES